MSLILLLAAEACVVAVLWTHGQSGARSAVARGAAFLFPEPRHNLLPPFARGVRPMGSVLSLVAGAAWDVRLAAVGLGATWGLDAWLRRRGERAWLAQLDRMLPDVLRSLSASIHQGMNAPRAVRLQLQTDDSAWNPVLQRILHETELGATLGVAMDRAARDLGSKGLALVAAAVSLSQQSGGPLDKTLKEAATSVESLTNLSDKMSALTAQGRMQGWVMGLLPWGFGGIMYALSPSTGALLFNTPQGHIVLMIAIGLECVGLFLLRKVLAVNI